MLRCCRSYAVARQCGGCVRPVCVILRQALECVLCCDSGKPVAAASSSISCLEIGILLGLWWTLEHPATWGWPVGVPTVPGTPGACWGVALSSSGLCGPVVRGPALPAAGAASNSAYGLEHCCASTIEEDRALFPAFTRRRHGAVTGTGCYTCRDVATLPNYRTFKVPRARPGRPCGPSDSRREGGWLK
jgi:hypothetical protein